jgi:molybdopterin-guanine dinucleotide biosynthesis protein
MTLDTAANSVGTRRKEMCHTDSENRKLQKAAVSKSEHTYLVYAKRNSSQFGQKLQEIRCRVLDARTNYILVESLKRYNKKYAGAAVTKSGTYKGIPVRRVNRDQILKIIDETTGKEVKWETIRRREGSQRAPGRARGGK